MYSRSEELLENSPEARESPSQVRYAGPRLGHFRNSAHLPVTSMLIAAYESAAETPPRNGGADRAGGLHFGGRVLTGLGSASLAAKNPS